MTCIAILTDSTAYIPADLVNLYNIRVIPLKIHWNGKTYLDGIDLTPTEFYARQDNSPETPLTSQPSIQDFIQVFDCLSQQYDGIVAPLISSGISGTVASARAAAAQFTGIPVEVIDSRTTSGALGLVVLAAARAANAGKNLMEVSEITKTAVKNQNLYFAVDTLKYLHRGGRIGGASRYLGTALSIKPILYFNEHGQIDALERVRTRRKALDRLVELAVIKANGNSTHIGLIHANAPDDASFISSKLSEFLHCEEIHTFELSPVIGAHIGPGTIGVAVYNEK
jgi:DegV family protein with EDD domain